MEVKERYLLGLIQDLGEDGEEEGLSQSVAESDQDDSYYKPPKRDIIVVPIEEDGDSRGQ